MEMDDASTEEKLVVELKNIRPLDLIEMATCLLSTAQEFKRYVSIHESSEVKLYVREVRNGSAIFELVAACWQVLPHLLEYGKALHGFFGDFKSVIGYLRREGNEERPKFEKKQLERIGQMMQPIAQDSPGAIYNLFYVEKGGKIADTLTINNGDANIIQNRVRQELEEMKEPVSGFHDDAVLYFYQTRDDARSDTGDKAVIERLAKSPVKTKFATEEAKAKVLGLKENIFRNAFVVDIRVETIDDKPVLYNVLRVKEVLPRYSQSSLPLLEGGDLSLPALT